MSSGGSGFMGFERGDSKLTRQRQVLELGTCGRPPKQSDRVNAGQVRAGWAGGRVGWTALLIILKQLNSSGRLKGRGSGPMSSSFPRHGAKIRIKTQSKRTKTHNQNQGQTANLHKNKT